MHPYLIAPALFALLIPVVPVLVKLLVDAVSPKIPKRLRAPAVLAAGAAVGVAANQLGMSPEDAAMLAGLTGPGAMMVHAAAGALKRRRPSDSGRGDKK